jgi:DNA polymerase-3 subunit delta
MQVLNQDIKERSFKQAYLLFGDEPYLVGNYKKRLREAIAGDDTMNFNYFEGKNPDVKEIIMDDPEAKGQICVEKVAISA